jgi:hypothetical protein
MTQERYMRPGLDFAVGKAIEELGELQVELSLQQAALGRMQQSLGKTLRWGWASVNPELQRHEQESNAIWVRREIKQVRLMLNSMGLQGEIRDVREALDNLEKEMEQNS